MASDSCPSLSCRSSPFLNRHNGLDEYQDNPMAGRPDRCQRAQVKRPVGAQARSEAPTVAKVEKTRSV